MNITATHLNYYFTCKRKLWLFSRNIKCEHDSDQVKIGKVYHEDYEKEQIQIDNIKIDKLRKGKVFELKKRNTTPEAAKFQVLYYLYVLREHGIHTTGVIKYKENNRLEEIELNEENEKHLIQAIEDIKKINQNKTPPHAKRNKYCKNCSYFELCFV